MPDTEGVFPDDVPVADAVEQQRPTSDAEAEDDPWHDETQDEAEVPLEASTADWQDQRETVPFDPELEEPDWGMTAIPDA